MIQITGVSHTGEPLNVTLDVLIDNDFDRAVLRGVAAREGRLAAVFGTASFYSARPSDEQLAGANTAATRYLRQRCQALQAQGGMLLGRQRWRNVLRVTLEERDVTDIQRDTLLAEDHDEN